MHHDRIAEVHPRAFLNAEWRDELELDVTFQGQSGIECLRISLGAGRLATPVLKMSAQGLQDALKLWSGGARA
jgi:hypothetical protein